MVEKEGLGAAAETDETEILGIEGEASKLAL